MGFLKSKRGELQSVQRRDRFGVHCIGTGRIYLKAHVDHRVTLRTPNRPVRNAGSGH